MVLSAFCEVVVAYMMKQVLRLPLEVEETRITERMTTGFGW